MEESLVGYRSRTGSFKLDPGVGVRKNGALVYGIIVLHSRNILRQSAVWISHMYSKILSKAFIPHISSAVAGFISLLLSLVNLPPSRGHVQYAFFE
jgi:hypothetical protein